jgi:squalene-associated FAD-dependent desaturase
MTDGQRVAIVGGGVAGLAAAVALSESPLDVQVFEAHRQLGGRAGSFLDAPAGQWRDHCQHVAMGCCTAYADFCRRTGIEHLFRSDRVLRFLAPNGVRYDLCGSSWLPPPLHLAPFLLRFAYLSWSERWGIAATVLRLARLRPVDTAEGPTIGQWLAVQRQSRRSIDCFWAPVLTGALGETLDRSSLAAARQVFVDGFLAHRRAYELRVPLVPLQTLYDHHVAQYLHRHGVRVQRGCRVRRVDPTPAGRMRMMREDGQDEEFDSVILAVSWRQIDRLLSREVLDNLPELRVAGQLPAAPITAVHLWFDHPVLNTPHAVLLGRLAQWVFADSSQDSPSDSTGPHYCQVVISASHQVVGRDRLRIARAVVEELGAHWPRASWRHVVRWRVLTRREAVFAAVPGLAPRRPAQATPYVGLWIAGDWTRTGWPATMEGAVRSGYLAATGVLTAAGHTGGPTIGDLPRGWLFRMLTGLTRSATARLPKPRSVAGASPPGTGPVDPTCATPSRAAATCL